MFEATASGQAWAYIPGVYGVIFDELEKFELQETGNRGLARIRKLTGRGVQRRPGRNLRRRGARRP